MTDLLAPRYKVIADYPNSTRIIGQIITPLGNEEGIEYWCKDKDKYPHLFRPMHWWEERKIEDMPEYVRCIKTPDQQIMPNEILNVKWNGVIGKDEFGRFVVVETNCFLPATLEEYTNYIKTKQ